MTVELPPVVDLCAASGLLARAFKDEGFPVVQGFELDPARASCWEANIGAPCQVADVRELTAARLARFAGPRGELVIIGGIPCQDFSTANRHRTMNTELRDHVLGIVRELRARSCIENVMEAWKGVPGVRAVRDADVGGFTIRVRGFYGAPEVPATHAEKPARRLDGAQLAPWRGWGEAIPGWDYMSDFTQQDDWENRHTLGVKPSWRPTWTITTKIDLAIWRSSKRKTLRWATTEDLAALQGFPADWELPRRAMNARGCIGDAVPYAMGRALARAMARDVRTAAEHAEVPTHA